MNTDNIEKLAEILTAYGLTSLEVADGSTRVRLEKRQGAETEPQRNGDAATLQEPDTEQEPGGDDLTVDFNNLLEVKSPLVGVYYSASSPDSETFVSIGSKVRKGDVLCIIETMKLMNEISAEQDGEIVDICVKNNDIVEYGQVLFKMK
ncbi:MAG: acetyl-CoA carboxylase biotin carboxyl carrier protein [Oscillospiraceae bacterium]|jgi:acetyl-CoA carboxylase biotin carboxyl carrier protein|nr:acetyl-CoA carboxylase biotin carboxyl carrier protein [Oscillospiraceae bacterium]